MCMDAHQDYIKITSSTPVTMKVHTTSTTVLLLVCQAAGLIGRPLYGVLQAHLCPSVQPAPHRGRYGIAALRWCLPARVCPVNARERVLDTCDCPDAVTCDQCVAIAQRQSCSGNHHPRQSPMAVRRKKSKACKHKSSVAIISGTQCKSSSGALISGKASHQKLRHQTQSDAADACTMGTRRDYEGHRGTL